MPLDISMPSFFHPICTEGLVKAVLERRHHLRFSVHGLSHWQRVERNGLYLADFLSADSAVVSLFALFHDSQRLNDFDDPEHGPRGAALSLDFFNAGLLPISHGQLDKLIFACTHHTDTTHHADPTIQCCWDGDRLDLTRIGVLPDPFLLNTSLARHIAQSMDFSEMEASRSIHGES